MNFIYGPTSSTAKLISTMKIATAHDSKSPHSYTNKNRHYHDTLLQHTWMLSSTCHGGSIYSNYVTSELLCKDIRRSLIPLSSCDLISTLLPLSYISSSNDSNDSCDGRVTTTTTTTTTTASSSLKKSITDVVNKFKSRKANTTENQIYKKNKGSLSCTTGVAETIICDELVYGKRSTVIRYKRKQSPDMKELQRRLGDGIANEHNEDENKSDTTLLTNISFLCYCLYDDSCTKEVELEDECVSEHPHTHMIVALYTPISDDDKVKFYHQIPVFNDCERVVFKRNSSSSTSSDNSSSSSDSSSSSSSDNSRGSSSIRKGSSGSISSSNRSISSTCRDSSSNNSSSCDHYFSPSITSLTYCNKDGIMVGNKFHKQQEKRFMITGKELQVIHYAPHYNSKLRSSTSTSRSNNISSSSSSSSTHQRMWNGFMFKWKRNVIYRSRRLKSIIVSALSRKNRIHDRADGSSSSRSGTTRIISLSFSSTSSSGSSRSRIDSSSSSGGSSTTSSNQITRLQSSSNSITDLLEEEDDLYCATTTTNTTAAVVISTASSGVIDNNNNIEISNSGSCFNSSLLILGPAASTTTATTSTTATKSMISRHESKPTTTTTTRSSRSRSVYKDVLKLDEYYANIMCEAGDSNNNNSSNNSNYCYF